MSVVGYGIRHMSVIVEQHGSVVQIARGKGQKSDGLPRFLASLVATFYFLRQLKDVVPRKSCIYLLLPLI
jgi:hypothetical protein